MHQILNLIIQSPLRFKNQPLNKQGLFKMLRIILNQNRLNLVSTNCPWILAQMGGLRIFMGMTTNSPKNPRRTSKHSQTSQHTRLNQLILKRILKLGESPLSMHVRSHKVISLASRKNQIREVGRIKRCFSLQDSLSKSKKRRRVLKLTATESSSLKIWFKSYNQQITRKIYLKLKSGNHSLSPLQKKARMTG